jgi:6-phosphogluconolactonase
MSRPTESLGEWRRFETAEVLADHAAEWLCLCVLACPHDREVAICLSGGSTPQRLYQRLASAPVASRMPWNRIHWFWGDERFVAHDDPASNYRMAHEALFSRAPVSPDHIHPIPTGGLTPEQAAAAYQSLLQTFYGSKRPEVIRPVFDVTLLGVGKDGHTASLFPGSSALHEERQWVLPVLAEASRARVTLTYPVLNSSRNLAFLATGASKKNILARIRGGDAAPPAARIRPIGRLTWFVDGAAMPDSAPHKPADFGAI